MCPYLCEDEGLWVAAVQAEDEADRLEEFLDAGAKLLLLHATSGPRVKDPRLDNKLKEILQSLRAVRNINTALTHKLIGHTHTQACLRWIKTSDLNRQLQCVSKPSSIIHTVHHLRRMFESDKYIKVLSTKRSTFCTSSILSSAFNVTQWWIYTVCTVSVSGSYPHGFLYVVLSDHLCRAVHVPLQTANQLSVTQQTLHTAFKHLSHTTLKLPSVNLCHTYILLFCPWARGTQLWTQQSSSYTATLSLTSAGFVSIWWISLSL